MKTWILITIAMLLLGLSGSGRQNTEKPVTENETIRICATPGTDKLAESWIMRYTEANPNVNFSITPVNLSEMKEKIADKSTLGIMMQWPNELLAGESLWRMVLGRNVVVTVINEENPFIGILNEKGISAKALSNLINNKKTETWGTLLDSRQNEPVHFCILNKPEVKLSVSKFLDADPLIISAIESKDADQFLDAIRSDKYAIGFCHLATVTDIENHDFAGNIKLLPVDRNNNGRIDFNENIYGRLDDFERAVWIGKYPKSMIYNIYAVASAFPENKNITGFLSWIVTSGQSDVEQSGFTDLVNREKQSNLEKLNPPVSLVETYPQKSEKTETVLLLSIAVVALATIVFLYVRKTRSGKLQGVQDKKERIFNEASLEFPNGAFFDKTHTWIFMEKDGTIKVGIDDFLQHVTGDFTGIIMKEPGEKLSKNELAVTLVNEGKKINIYAPVSGIIKEINEDLVDFPSLINSSPYSWGWIYAMEPANWSREIGFLKLADSYKVWIKKEFIRLKDFLSTVSQNHIPEGQLIYQEGGELTDHVLSNFDPKVWEDFQTTFIDTSDIS